MKAMKNLNPYKMKNGNSCGLAIRILGMPGLWAVVIVAIITLSTGTSCTKDSNDGPKHPCDTIDVTYSGVIQPLLEANCYECHANGQSRKGVTLGTYDGVYAVAISGQLSGAVNHSAGYSGMPYYRPPLDSCSIYFIDKWIDEGAPQN
jgi:hypothetical protein